MSSQGQGYGPWAFVVGVLFWGIAGAMFTFPFWGPLLGFAFGLLGGMK